MGTTQRPNERLAPHWLLGLVLLAIVLRVAWALIQIPVAQGDECEYLRIAERLLHAHQYQGLYEGPQVIYPPLPSVLIALLATLGLSLSTAGLVVGVISGVSLVLSVNFLGRHLYGLRVGLLAATLVAVNPVLIQLSASIQSETLDIALVVAGVYFAVRWIDERRLGPGIACGALFSAAYLTRPEAIVCPLVIAAAFILTARLHDTTRRKALVGVLPMLAVATLIGAPYVAYLSHETGEFRLQGKSVVQYSQAQRLNAGMSLDEALYGLGPNASEDGSMLSPNTWILAAPPSVPISNLARGMIPAARRNLTPLRWTLESGAFGGWLVIALSALGVLFPKRTDSRLASHVLVLLLVAGYTCVLLFSAAAIFLRYTILILPFLLIWAANAAAIPARWASKASMRRVPIPGKLGKGALTIATAGLLVIDVILLGAWDPSSGYFRVDAPREWTRVKAGCWLANTGSSRPGRPMRIMSGSNDVPFYADAIAMRFPYANENDALAYVRAKNPDYVVLIGNETQMRPFYAEWLKHGIPDPEARLVHEIGPSDNPEAAIFEWTEGGQNGSSSEHGDENNVPPIGGGSAMCSRLLADAERASRS